MSIAVRPRQPVANDHSGAIARLLGLDKTVILGLKDLSVGGNGIGYEGLGLTSLEDTEEGRVGTFGAPATIEVRDPGRREEIDHLAKQPVVVLLRARRQFHIS